MKPAFAILSLFIFWGVVEFLRFYIHKKHKTDYLGYKDENRRHDS